MSYKLSAKIVKTFGADGGLLVAPTADGTWTVGQRFFVALNGLWTPFFVKNIRPLSAKIVVIFENIESIALAESLVGKELYEKSDEEQPSDSTKRSNYEGYVVVDGGKVVGTIRQLLNFNGNLCFEVAADGGAAILIPAHPDFIVRIDRRKQRVVMELPDGLFSA